MIERAAADLAGASRYGIDRPAIRNRAADKVFWFDVSSDAVGIPAAAAVEDHRRRQSG